MSAYDFDYFVIGAGSGGVRSARIAGGHGAKVGITEGRFYGGTCVNVGCVPKKLFVYAADFGEAFTDSLGYGWKTEKPAFDWQKLIENKDHEIDRLNRIYRNLLDKAGVTRFDEYAHFIDAHTLQVGTQTVTADKILIATGGRPRRPSFPGAEHALVSDDMFYLEALPKHIVIQGGGYIAVEFAHVFKGLGSSVTLLYRGDMFLRGFDRDIAQCLHEEMKNYGIHIHFNCDITAVEKQGESLTIQTDTEITLRADAILSAIGREPEIGKLCLKPAGVEFDTSGRILVNDHYQTSQPHIYAVGDVCNRHNLTPVALAEGHIVADRLFGPGRGNLSYDNIPTAVFSRPPIGTVGLSEEEARARGLAIDIYESRFKPMKFHLSGRNENFYIKLIVNKPDGKILGLHMVGDDAPEILQGFAVAIKAGATKADFDATLGIHPTAAEELVTLRTVSTR